MRIGGDSILTSLPVLPTRRSTLAYAALLVCLSAYLLYARVGESAQSFLMLDDQIRDWRLALGPFGSLPLVGTASTAGGSSLGPIYYWVLWLSRITIGALIHNQPHAGAYGIALLQGAADLLLLEAVRRRFASLPLALAAVLATATAAHDLAVSSTIWNPAVSVAFVKVALALRLLPDERRSLWWSASVMAASWLAVQAHSSAIFVAAPLALSELWLALRGAGVMAALERVRLFVEVIVLLQVPWLVHLISHASEAAPTRAVAGATDALAGGHLRMAASYHAALDGLTSILVAPWQGRVAAVLLVLLLAVSLVRCRRDVSLVAMTVAPPVLAVLGFALWQGEYNEYWYLPLAPCVALGVVLGATAWKHAVLAPVTLALVLVAQPGHLAVAHTYYRLPEYGPLSAGSVRLARQAPSLRRVYTEFGMPMFSDETFPYQAAGGRIAEDAAFDGWIDRNGGIRFTPVRSAGVDGSGPAPR